MERPHKKVCAELCLQDFHDSHPHFIRGPLPIKVQIKPFSLAPGAQFPSIFKYTASSLPIQLTPLPTSPPKQLSSYINTAPSLRISYTSQHLTPWRPPLPAVSPTPFHLKRPPTSTSISTRIKPRATTPIPQTPTSPPTPSTPGIMPQTPTPRNSTS